SRRTLSGARGARESRAAARASGRDMPDPVHGNRRPQAGAGGLPDARRALISMMAGSTCSNQRPDTLVQDRIRQIDEIPLRRTAGPYIWVKTGKSRSEPMFSGLPPKADLRSAR